MEAKPFIVNRSNILIDDLHIAGVKSLSFNSPNELYNAQTTSGKSFYKDLTTKSVASASLTKYGSVEDFSNILQTKILTTSLFGCEIFSDQAGTRRDSIVLTDCAFDNFGFGIIPNEISEVSFEMSSSDYAKAFVTDATEVSDSSENYLTNANFLFTSSNPLFNMAESVSVTLTIGKIFIRGLGGSKKVWRSNLQASISLRINDYRKQFDNDPETLPATDFLIEVFADEKKTNKVCEFNFLESSLTSYAEGYTDSAVSAMDMTFIYMDNTTKNAITFI